MLTDFNLALQLLGLARQISSSIPPIAGVSKTNPNTCPSFILTLTSFKSSTFFENDDFLSIVLELCKPLTLLDRIVANPLWEPHAASRIKQLLEAVAHCHRLDVAHRDIQPDNILFDSNDNLKLGDFGSAEWFGDGRTMSGVVGTPYYVAPEVLMGRDYSEKVDVWSCGVILYISSGFLLESSIRFPLP